MPNLLAGKLFDEAGEPLYVTGTSKGRRRYRYYVSRRLVTAPAKPTKTGWRLPAPEIERTVIAAAAQILEDRAALGTLLHETAGMPAHSLAGALEVLDDCRMRLQAESVSTPTAGPLIVRVELGEHALQLTLNLAVLLGDHLEPVTRAALSIRRSVPMRLRRRGVESRIILEGAGAKPTMADAVLLKALVRGRGWFQELASNRAKDIISIAECAGFHQSYVKRLIPLAFLAPGIVEMICAGQQPPQLTVERLTRRARLPLAWVSQLNALGLNIRTP